MKKISINIIKILLILIILQTIFTTTCQAGFWGDILDTGEQFLTDAKDSINDPNTGGSPIDETALKTEIEKFYNMFLIIGIAVAVIAGAVIGIKFLTGTIVEQAKIKEILIPYVIGCVVIFGAFGIWKLVMTILGSI